MSLNDNEINQNVDEILSAQNSQNIQTDQEKEVAQTTSQSEQIEEERNKVVYDATHGSDRATFRDEDMKFTSGDQPGARLHFTPTQVESAREEMNTDLERRRIEEEATRAAAHQEALDSNTKANEGFQPLRQSDGFKNHIDEQKQAEERAIAHQEALDSNEKANEGFNPLIQSDGYTNWRQAQTRADAHQEALDSNEKANEGFQPLRQSNGYSNWLQEQERAAAHQEALDSNAKANEGFDPSLQSDGYMNWRKSLEDQEKQETTPVQPEEGTNLGDIDSRLEEMNIHLSEINQNIQRLLEDREISSLTPEQLLEYITLLQEQSRIQAEINQTTINKILATIENNNNISISNTNETNVNMPPIQPTPPEPPEPPRPPITIPEPITAESDRVAQLEDQLRELRGENTPEQRSMALGKRLTELESKLANGGLTDAEKIEYFDIMNQKREIDKQINAAQEESERKRKNKEKWIKIAAGVVGVGVALATPAIGCAAVLGVTLGGRIVGKGLQSLSTKLRTKSNAIKYEPREGKTLEQLNEMDRKQKRNAWWANRLGEASAVLIGGATGYGLGNLFEGIVGKDFYIGMNNQPTPQIPTGAEPQTPAEPQAPEAPQVEQPTTTTTPEIPTSEIPVSTDWIPGETFNASDFGWDYNQMGWLGDKVYLTNAGENSILQRDFFTELSKLVPKDVLMGQNSGNIVDQFLRSAYGGMNPTEAAGKAAELLLGK